MNYPDSYRYTKEHEWVRVDGDVATVGITHFAQHALGDVVYVDLPKTGTKVEQMQQFGTVESVKTISELYAPVAGEIVDVNGNLEGHPEVVNSDPHDGGWMIKIRLSNPSEVNNLLDAAAYARVAAE
jgi:glycine cleavage system H protein